MRVSARAISGLVVVSLILLYIAANISSTENMKSEETKSILLLGKQYSPHEPIRINSDADFTPQNGVVGGNGTKDDPYIIEGWDIDAHGSGSAIYIGNTTKYFIISNCRLYNTSEKSYPYFYGNGITLYNVSNGRVQNTLIFNNENYGVDMYSLTNNMIVNNTIYNNSEAIHLDHSTNNIIMNNTIYNHTYQSIYLYYSGNNKILNNTIYSNGGGLIFYYSSDCVITNNYFENIKAYGIYLSYSGSNKLYSNKFINTGIIIKEGIDTWTTQEIPSNNTVNGKPIYYYKNANMNNSSVPTDAGQVIAGKVSYLSIENLNIENAWVGIQIGYSSHVRVINNTLSHNQKYGIYLHYSSHNLIEYNNMSGSDEGIYLYHSDNNVLLNNHMADNDDSGVFLKYSSYNYLYSNNMVNGGISLMGNKTVWTSQEIPQNNTLNGKPVYYYKNANMNNSSVPSDAGQVILGNVSHLYIKNLDIHNATTGILIGYSSYIFIQNNSICNNSAQGILMEKSSNIFVEGNTIHNNTIYGIYLSSSGNSTIDNNTIEISAVGIWIYSSSNNTINYNKIRDNFYGIYMYWNSEENIITDNVIENNSDYGIAIDWGGNNNMIFNNIFRYNRGSEHTYNASRVQAYDSGSNNKWYSSSGIGNYWLDWAENNNTNDQNGDGIVDWGYKIDGYAGAMDYYPLKTSPSISEFQPIWLIVLIGLAAGIINLSKKLRN